MVIVFGGILRRRSRWFHLLDGRYLPPVHAIGAGASGRRYLRFIGQVEQVDRESHVGLFCISGWTPVSLANREIVWVSGG